MNINWEATVQNILSTTTLVIIIFIVRFEPKAIPCIRPHVNDPVFV